MSSGKIGRTAVAERQVRAADADIRAVADELYRERVLEARRMPPEEKLLAGEELFDYACAITLGGIRNQFPAASEEECLRMLGDRLKLREEMERRG
jgi:hypothetical protein